MENINLWRSLKWAFVNIESHPKGSFESIFTFLCFFIAVGVFHTIVRYPINKYYDWEDPLDKPGQMDEVSSEATLRRMKY